MSKSETLLITVHEDGTHSMAVRDGVLAGCGVCGHLTCVCKVQSGHKAHCKYRRAVCCPVPIECDHGYDVCSICDPCTCDQPEES